ncbi:class I SAM-dependent methyltransferase [Candidatus Poribacteria bacterium]|nr:class I SAM-dependent methyltransferase [Candidatus Poribacteria bacterium]
MSLQITPPYEKFSYSYDRMMKNVNYPRWMQYIESIFDKYGSKPRKILDLACGTGALTLLLAAKGYEMSGFDRAIGMLEIARQKAESQDLSISFFQGDMMNFDLNQKFDAILCTYDSINYANSVEELRSTFEGVSSHLEPEGIFIFDVTTERNIVEHFHNKTFSENHEDYSYIWKNNYLHHSKLCRTFLTFFIREGDVFRRYEEIHNQRIFDVSTVDNALESSGFKMLSACDMYTFNRWTRNSDRINFTAQLVKSET